MGSILVALVKWLIDKWFGYKTKQADSATERETIKAQSEEAKDKAKEVILTSTGAWWFQLFFIIPLAFWFASVLLYSVFWCRACAFPQPWTIAALPSPLTEWAGAIIAFLFLTNAVKK